MHRHRGVSTARKIPQRLPKAGLAAAGSFQWPGPQKSHASESHSVDQVNLRCVHLVVLMHTRTLRGGLDELELSLGLLLSKLVSKLHLQTKAMLETQRQAATAHTSSWSTQEMVQQGTASTGRLVRQRVASCSSCLLKGSLGAMPGCAGWAGGLCQPRQDPGEGSGVVTGHLHDAEPHSRGPTVWCLAS